MISRYQSSSDAGSGWNLSRGRDAEEFPKLQLSDKASYKTLKSKNNGQRDINVYTLPALKLQLHSFFYYITLINTPSFSSSAAFPYKYLESSQEARAKLSQEPCPKSHQSSSIPSSQRRIQQSRAWPLLLHQRPRQIKTKNPRKSCPKALFWVKMANRPFQPLH